MNTFYLLVCLGVVAFLVGAGIAVWRSVTEVKEAEQQSAQHNSTTTTRIA